MSACSGSSTRATDAGTDAGADAGTDAGSDAGSDAGPDAGSDAGVVPRPDAGPSCLNDAGVCGAGFCADGVCSSSCANQACPAGDYCESADAGFTICSPNTPAGCVSNLDCPEPEVCLGGNCQAQEEDTSGSQFGCTVGGNPDGCLPDAVCYATNDGAQTSTGCFALTHCGSTGSCPAGTSGAVCNAIADGGVYIAGKERLCLIGLCGAASDCPESATLGQAHCFRLSPSNRLGHCYFGENGDPCFTTADCDNSVECVFSDGGVDDGGALGSCLGG